MHAFHVRCVGLLWKRGVGFNAYGASGKTGVHKSLAYYLRLYSDGYAIASIYPFNMWIANDDLPDNSFICQQALVLIAVGYTPYAME